MTMKKTVDAFAVTAVALLASVASAATYYVDNKLSDYTGADGSEAKPFQKIQQAVNKAANDDTVLVKPGVYGEDQGTFVDLSPTDTDNQHYSYGNNRVWINNKHITLKSTDGAAVTHIVGRHSTEEGGMGKDAVRCIAMSGSGNIGGTRIEGFTIRDGASMKLNEGKTTKGSSCETSHCGGGLLLHYTAKGHGEQIHVVDCVVSNCVAAQGAAAYGVSFIRSRIEKNHSGRSYGATVTQCNAVNSIFADNGIADYEGTVRSVESQYPISVVNCTFWNNKGMLQAPSGAIAEPTIVNSIVQCNAGNNGNSIASNGSKIFYTLADVGGVVNFNTTADGKAINVACTTRGQRASLAAPLFGDFHPVTTTAGVKPFGIANKAKYDECTAWVPEADKAKDLAGDARWESDGTMTAGAYQKGVTVGGGCLAITGNGCGFKIDGKAYNRPENAYFFASNALEQHRVTFTTTASTLAHVWLGGYTGTAGAYRFPDLNGDVIVTLPQSSGDTMLCVEARLAKKVLWVDASAAQDGADGTSANPYPTIQAAVDAVTDATLTTIFVKKGDYKVGEKSDADSWGKARVLIPKGRSIQIRAVDGPDKTFITGEPEVRCVDIEIKTEKNSDGVYVPTGDAKPCGLVGFTLRDGQTMTAKQNNQLNYIYGGAFFANDQAFAQLTDCVITNCSGVRGSAAYKGWFTNCRILGCKHPTSTEDRRGVFYRTYLSGCFVGPNAYETVSIDQECKLWNVTLAETAHKQLMSSSVWCYNVLALNTWTQGNAGSGYELRNCAFHVANPNGISVTSDYKFTESPVVDSANDDIRPKTGSAVVGKGVRVNNLEFIKYMTGGYYHETFPAGAFPIGASSDVAVPVTVTNKKGVSAESELNAGYTSAAHPLVLTATLTDHKFLGWKVNGAEEYASTEQTFALAPTAGVASYSIEGCYKPNGLILILR